LRRQNCSDPTSSPDGCETLVGERGVGLSGGQSSVAIAVEHRISLPHSLMPRPLCSIQESLDDLMRHKAHPCVAQRISTVRNADRILLMDKDNW